MRFGEVTAGRTTARASVLLAFGQQLNESVFELIIIRTENVLANKRRVIDSASATFCSRAAALATNAHRLRRLARSNPIQSGVSQSLRCDAISSSTPRFAETGGLERRQTNSLSNGSLSFQQGNDLHREHRT